MPYVLGIDIGAGATKAAVCRRTDGPGWGPPQPVALGLRSRTVGSGLVMTPEGDVVPVDHGRAPAESSVGGYLHRVGDSQPMLFGGAYFPAHGLVAAMARWVVDRVWQQLDEPPERIALAYPSVWGNGRLHLLHSALGEADLAQTALVTRARAVVESHQAAGRMPAACGMLLAYRIGGSTCEVSVAVVHGPGRLELLGCAEMAEVSGFDLRDATPAEARAALQPTVDLALHTVSGCGATRGDLAAVLIAGGSADVYPHVSDLLSAAFPVPVLRDPDPPMTVAAGAALAVRPLMRRPGPPPTARPPSGPQAAPRSSAGPQAVGRPSAGPQAVGRPSTGPPWAARPPAGPPSAPAAPPAAIAPASWGAQAAEPFGTEQAAPWDTHPAEPFDAERAAPWGTQAAEPLGMEQAEPWSTQPGQSAEHWDAPPAEPPEAWGMEPAGLAAASWPEITRDGRTPDRPPRPPVAVAAVRAEGR